MFQSNYGAYNPSQMNGLRQTIAPQQPVAMPQPAPIPYLKGHPVSSLEEARATTIDFDGSVFFFPDLANKRIYTKQINMDGTSSLNMYELQKLPIAPTDGSIYITREEFDNALKELRESVVLAANKQVQAQPITNTSANGAQPQNFNF